MLLSVLLFLGAEDAILIAAVVLLLFGGKKIPELMHSLGKGVNSFKQGMEGLEEKTKTPTKTDLAKEPEKEQPADKIVR